MRVWFINLDRSKDRLAEFINVNNHLTDAVRFPAVDGQSLDIQFLAGKGLVTADILNTYVIGAVGCSMSHVALWDSAIETGQPLTMCEDDAIFNHRFEFYADQVIRTLPPEWDYIQWGWNVDAFFIFEFLPGVSDCLALFQKERWIANVETFQHQALSPRVYKLVCSFGTPCYTVSAKGARTLKDKLLPFRPGLFPTPEGFSGLPTHFAVAGIDCALSTIYRQINAFTCFPPLVVTKGDRATSTIGKRYKR